MSGVKLVCASVAFESGIAGPFVAQRIFVIRSNEDFAAQFAKFRLECEGDDFKVVHSVCETIETVNGFEVILTKGAQ